MMDAGCDSNSTATSLEDHSEDFEDNPTRDTLTEGLMCLLKPSLDSLDSQAEATLPCLVLQITELGPQPK